MIKTLTRGDFSDEFYKMGRGNQFTHDALTALFEYYEELDPMYDLDVIEICCDWSEYNSIYELDTEYGYGIDELKENTTVIDLPLGHYLVQNF